jgi:hypothetical protein
VKNLSITGIFQLSKELIDSITNSFPNLHKLTLCHLIDIESQQLCYLRQKLINLQNIELKSCKVVNDKASD